MSHQWISRSGVYTTNEPELFVGRRDPRRVWSEEPVAGSVGATRGGFDRRDSWVWSDHRMDPWIWSERSLGLVGETETFGFGRRNPRVCGARASRNSKFLKDSAKTLIAQI